MPETGGPWWSVPLLAGLFVVLGALVAFFSTRASDNRKAKREEKERIMSDSREAAMDVIEAARTIQHLAMMQQTESRALPADKLTTLTSDATTKLENAWSRFQVYGDEKAIEAGTRLMVASMLLKNPGIKERAAIDRSAIFIKACTDFINILRVNASLPKLHVPDLGLIDREDSIEEHGELPEELSRSG
ncbi:hypothetical protein J2W14_003993 [Pseudarthrobacter oxydans]|uniref:hypothetical protein n=1 Tax=Pseudarthrobacter oxydans TaxID=1671 RepID=UPI002786945C|nr:hypothetical protein [Pseudarthrobacter oxydans]MDP9984566.1 hypothetical protein [Pseudarthrobacter oxydans]